MKTAVQPAGTPGEGMPGRARLQACVARFSGLTITVWGDLVADEFLDGEIARVSREAPVLILKRRGRRLAPGGGANAAANLAALGVRVRLVGVVGTDVAGAELLAHFRGQGVDVSGVVPVRGRVTPVKTRILAHHPHTKPQQVIRIDQEPSPLPPARQAALERNLTRQALRASRGSTAMLISDYGYGAVSPLAAASVRRQRPELLVSLDARFQIGSYRGVGAATPNEAELEAALGVEVGGDLRALERAGHRLRRRLECDKLLITRGRDGMALFEAGRKVRHWPVHGTQQALDVTGAGDTVIAVFTAALAGGAEGAEAAYLANCAGGLVVMKPGTATISARELSRALAAENP